MDIEAKFWITTWGIVATCFVAVVVVVGINVNNVNKLYYAAVEKCAASGGTWLPVRDGGICLILQAKQANL